MRLKVSTMFRVYRLAFDVGMPDVRVSYTPIIEPRMAFQIQLVRIVCLCSFRYASYTKRSVTHHRKEASVCVAPCVYFEISAHIVSVDVMAAAMLNVNVFNRGYLQESFEYPGSSFIRPLRYAFKVVFRKEYHTQVQLLCKKGKAVFALDLVIDLNLISNKMRI